MEQFTMRQKSHRVIRLVSSQFVAFMGWIAVQSFFPLSLIGQVFPFVLSHLHHCSLVKLSHSFLSSSSSSLVEHTPFHYALAVPARI